MNMSLELVQSTLQGWLETLTASTTNMAAGGAIAAIIAFALLRRGKSAGNGLPLPPGFPKRFFVGNLFEMPKEFEWKVFAEWGKILKSDIIHADISGQIVVVLNSMKAADDLLDKRASVYSSRPRMPMVNELIGWDWLFAFMPYGENWQNHRKLFRQEFHHSATQRYLPHTLKATHQILLPRLLDNPEDFIEHMRYYIGAIIMGVAYGIDIKASDDPYIGTAETAFHGLVVASMPGAFLVDSIPILKYVPSWFPGASFKRKAHAWGAAAARMINVPYAEVKRNIAAGKQKPSFISYCLENMDKSQDLVYQERMIKEVSAQIYVAGSDTTVSALETLMLALTCYPEVARKAQDELDRVLGGRLPDFGDRDSLPYITAIMKETFRWNPTTPVCIPHCTTQEDVYRGYRIPKGATIVANAWAMLHDESTYYDPHTFIPERWLDSNGQIVSKSVLPDPWVMFGYGRRTCPGQFLPTATVWIACATVLSLFNVEKPIDEFGKVIEPTQEFTSALTVHTVPFLNVIKPRSRDSELKIRAVAAAAAGN